MIEVDIESLAYGGDGVGRLPDGRTVFVALSAPGDRVAIEVVEERDRFVRAKAAEVTRASGDRVDAPCRYFGLCGGCTWQHVSAAAQLEAKRRSVTDALTRIGRIEEAADLVAPTLSAGPRYGYRNKIELVHDSSSSRPAIGFHRAHSDQVVRVEECLLLPKRHSKAPKALSGALRYLAGDGDLGIRRVGLRCGANTRDVEIALWTEPGPFPRAAAARTLGQALQSTSLVRVLTKGPSKERRVSGVEVLSGKGHWKERLGGFTFAVSAPSFFQVNTPAAEALVALVMDELAPDGSDRALDLYAGAGTFTLPLAAAAGEVVSIEAAGSAVRDLRRNLEANASWSDVIGGDAAREIAALGYFDVVVVDPPRSGLDAAVIAALASNRPRKLAYVSCDPTTLARDAARLIDEGYRLTSATPVDLFPQTYHVETVAFFEPI